MSKQVTKTYKEKLQERDYTPIPYKKPKIPGFELGVDTSKNEIVIESKTPNPTSKSFDDQLERMGYDPKHFKIESNRLEHRSWDMAIGDGQVQTMHYVKARIVKRMPEHDISNFISNKFLRRPASVALAPSTSSNTRYGRAWNAPAAWTRTTPG